VLCVKQTSAIHLSGKATDRSSERRKQESMFTAVVERGQCHQYLLGALSTLKPGGGSGGRGGHTVSLQMCKGFQVPPACPSEKCSMNMTTTGDVRGLILIGENGALGENHVPGPLCSPHISRGKVRVRNWASAVRGR
jgi:hypothetical protein